MAWFSRQGDCMANFVLISTFVVCLFTFGVLVPRAPGGFEGGFFDALFFSGPFLALGIYLFLAVRNQGWRDAGGLLAPSRVGVLFAWVPNLLILTALNLQHLGKVLTLANMSETTTSYLLLLPTWALSIVTGAVGATATVIARDRARARQK